MKGTYPRFPVFIRLENKEILFIGAGAVAKRRIRILLDFGCRITVIAPKIPKKEMESFRDWIEKGQVQYIKKEYNKEDVSQAVYLVFAATDDPDTNHAIVEECRKKGILVNNASDAEECDFYFPSVIKNGEVMIGITGSGKNHKEVRRTREKIQCWMQKQKNSTREKGV